MNVKESIAVPINALNYTSHILVNNYLEFVMMLLNNKNTQSVNYISFYHNDKKIKIPIISLVSLSHLHINKALITYQGNLNIDTFKIHNCNTTITTKTLKRPCFKKN